MSFRHAPTPYKIVSEPGGKLLLRDAKGRCIAVLAYGGNTEDEKTNICTARFIKVACNRYFLAMDALEALRTNLLTARMAVGHNKAWTDGCLDIIDNVFTTSQKETG